MKQSLLAVFTLVLSAILFTGCLEEPGDVALTANKTTVAVDEEVTLTLSGVENSTCVVWSQSGGPSFIEVNPISANAMSVTVKFAATGTVKMMAAVQNCKKGGDGCTGTCKGETAEINVTVE
jgi:hypothetical protein